MLLQQLPRSKLSSDSGEFPISLNHPWLNQLRCRMHLPVGQFQYWALPWFSANFLQSAQYCWITLEKVNIREYFENVNEPESTGQGGPGRNESWRESWLLPEGKNVLSPRFRQLVQDKTCSHPSGLSGLTYFQNIISSVTPKNVIKHGLKLTDKYYWVDETSLFETLKLAWIPSCWSTKLGNIKFPLFQTCFSWRYTKKSLIKLGPKLPTFTHFFSPTPNPIL